MAETVYTIKGRKEVIDAIYAQLATIDAGYETKMFFKGTGGEVTRGYFEGLLPPHAAMTPEGLERLVKTVKKEWAVKEADHPFGVRRGHYALMKEINAQVMDYDETAGTAAPLANRAQIRDGCVRQAFQYKDTDYFEKYLRYASEEQIGLLFDAQGHSDSAALYKGILANKITAIPADNPSAKADADKDEKGADGLTIAALVTGGATLLYSLYKLIAGKETTPPKDSDDKTPAEKKGPGFLEVAGVTVGAIVTGMAIYAMYNKKPIGQVFSRSK